MSSLLVPIGIALIAGAVYVFACRPPAAFAPALARARALAWLPDALCIALLVALALVMLGRVAAGDRPVSGDDPTIVSALRDALNNSKDKVVILAGDRQVVLGEVVRVLGLAKEAGASGFALASE